MLLHSLYLHCFRYYKEAYFEFGPHFNFIFGPNAQGKTTILEAIYYLMLGRSFRSTQSLELIKHGTSSFYLEGIFSKQGIEQKLRVAFNGKERKMIYNSTLLPTVSSLLGIIQGVVLTPDDVNLVKGTPLLRRQFLDTQIAQIDPLYVHYLTRYTRAMRQRNQLLKAKQQLTIESWEHEMSQSAAYIVMQRHQTVQNLQVHCQHMHSILTKETAPLDIIYKTHRPNELNRESICHYLLDHLKKNRAREMSLGYTLMGPHKDDLLLTIGGEDVRSFASEGQQRSCAMTLHFAEWRHLNQIGEETPLMMIDDVGMGLDMKRRQYLLEQLSLLGQVFLTTTDENLLQYSPIDQKLFYISKT